MTTAEGVSVESIGYEQYLAVSPAGIALIIKSVYDTEHNDTYAPAVEPETAGSANE